MLTFHGSNSTKYINDIYIHQFTNVYLKGFILRKHAKLYISYVHRSTSPISTSEKKMEIGVCNLFFRILFLDECDTIKNFKK